MSLILLKKDTTDDPQCIDGADIDSMRAIRIALAIAGEGAVANHDSTARIRAAQDSIFIVPKSAPFDRKILPHRPDARSVLFGRPRVRKCDVANRNVGTNDHKDRLVLANPVAYDHVALAF